MEVEEQPPDPKASWSPLRRQLHTLLMADVTEKALGFIIFTNLVLLIIETDANADVVTIEDFVGPYGLTTDGLSDMGPPPFVQTANQVLMGVYTVELSTRLFVMRTGFFYDTWCCLDMLIVGSDLILAFLGLIMGTMPKVGILRVFRLLRLARAFKALSKFPELALLLRGFACALKAIFWGILLVIIVLTIWSILAVQLLHPINLEVANEGLYDGCDRCPRAFSSVWNSLATFTQQLVAGDSWGTVSLPIIEKNPVAYIFFLAVLVSVSLAIMNLILAVIVDSANEARQEALEKSNNAKDEEFRQATERFSDLCKDLDADGSGYLSLAELIDGYDRNPLFAETMQVMNCGREDLAVIFSSLDRDLSGSVNYPEFVKEMNKMRSETAHQILQFIQFHVIDMRKLILESAAAASPAIAKEVELTALADVKRTPSTPPPGFKTPATEPLSAAGAPRIDGSWEPLPQPAAQGQGAQRSASSADDALAELKRVNQDLVLVMKQMVERTEAHTRILTNLSERLPFQGNWVPLNKDASGISPSGGDIDGQPKATADPWGSIPAVPGPLGPGGPGGSAGRSLGIVASGGYVPERRSLEPGRMPL